MRVGWCVVAALLVVSAADAKIHLWDRASHPKTYSVELPENAHAGNVALKRGSYRMAIEQSKVILTSVEKDQRFEIPAKVEMAAKKFDETSVRVRNGGASAALEEIDIGGTTTKVEFP